MRNWISVRDRKPDKTGVYPAMSDIEGREPPKDWLDAFCYFNAEAKSGESEWQHSSGFYDNSITHWMPLPEPPTGESNA